MTKRYNARYNEVP